MILGIIRPPALHKSVGIILFATMVFRVLWRLFTRQPKSVATHSAFIRFAAKAGHLVIYLMLFGIMVSGYLISTADGVGIPVFGMFEVPALIYRSEERRVGKECRSVWKTDY